MQTIDQACVNTLRFLAADQVEKAKSGHPGFPLGTAPLMYTIWDRFMNYNFCRNFISKIYRINILIQGRIGRNFYPVRIFYCLAMKSSNHKSE